MLQKILSFSEDLYLSHFETVVHGGDDDYDGGDHDRDQGEEYEGGQRHVADPDPIRSQYCCCRICIPDQTQV